jgi:hypothetical protein
MVSDCKYIFLEYLGAVDGRREEGERRFARRLLPQLFDYRGRIIAFNNRFSIELDLRLSITFSPMRKYFSNIELFHTG